jgi:hypothetical protein
MDVATAPGSSLNFVSSVWFCWWLRLVACFLVLIVLMWEYGVQFAAEERRQRHAVHSCNVLSIPIPGPFFYTSSAS